MKLIVITQKVDSHDDLLGFFVGWLRELAKRVDEVVVITLAKGSHDLPENVKVLSLGKERGLSKWRQAFNFYTYLWRQARGADRIFAHMSPVFAIAAWPIAVLRGAKLIFWYVHRSVTAKLRLAVALSDKVLTVSKDSLRLQSDKIMITGHGIDSDYFKPRPGRVLGDVLHILLVGRISKIKNYETIIEAAMLLKAAGERFKITIVGRPVMGPDFEYFDVLKKLVAEKQLQEHIDFVGFIPYSQLLGYYEKADCAVNLAPTGGLDKVVLEAMACGLPVFVSNHGFIEYFGVYAELLACKYQDGADLAHKLRALRGYDVQEIGSYLRSVIVERHSIQNVVNTIISA